MTDVPEHDPKLARLLEILDWTVVPHEADNHHWTTTEPHFHLTPETRAEALKLLSEGVLDGRAMKVTPSTKYGRYTTLLYLAARQDEAELVRALVRAGSSLVNPWVDSAPDELRRHRNSALTEAVQGNAPRALSALLELGADPNQPDHDDVGRVPVAGAGAECLRILLEAGADPLIPDKNGMTPLDHCLGDAMAYPLMMEYVRKREAEELAAGGPPKPAYVIYSSADGPVDLSTERGVRRMFGPDDSLEGADLWFFVHAPADAVSDAFVRKGVFKRRWAKEVERGGEVHRFGDASDFGFVLQLRGIEWSVVMLARDRMRSFSSKVASLGKALGVDAISIEGAEAFLLRDGASIDGAMWHGEDLVLTERQEDAMSAEDYDAWEKKIEQQIEQRYEQADAFFAERGIFFPRMAARQIGKRPELVLFDLKPEDVEALHLVVFKR